MSNFLAPATVTAVLEQRLQAALDRDLPGATAAAGSPRTDGDQRAGVVIFLVRIEPNAALETRDLPTRSSDGTLRCRPEVALDLDYLMLCYGTAEALEPERVMGIVATTLNAEPLIGSGDVAEVLAAAVDPISPIHEFLQDSDLDEQQQPVRLTPVTLPLEGQSNIWTGAQAPWTLTLAYRASPLLLEAQTEVSVSTPVRARTVRAIPVEPPLITAAGGAVSPLQADGVLVLVGSSLRGELTTVRVGEQELPVTDGNAQRISVPLTGLAEPPTAGRNPVVVTHRIMLGQPATPHTGSVSRPTSVVIHPTVTAASVVDGSIRLETDLVLRADATVALDLLDPATGALRHRIGARTSDPAAEQVDFPAGSVAAGTYRTKLDIDGESGPTGPEVTVP